MPASFARRAVRFQGGATELIAKAGRKPSGHGGRVKCPPEIWGGWSGLAPLSQLFFPAMIKGDELRVKTTGRGDRFHGQQPAEANLSKPGAKVRCQLSVFMPAALRINPVAQGRIWRIIVGDMTVAVSGFEGDEFGPVHFPSFPADELNIPVKADCFQTLAAIRAEALEPGVASLPDNPGPQLLQRDMMARNPAMAVLFFVFDQLRQFCVPLPVQRSQVLLEGGDEGVAPVAVVPLEADLFQASDAVRLEFAVIAKAALIGHPVGEERVFGPMAVNIAVAEAGLEVNELGKALLPTRKLQLVSRPVKADFIQTLALFRRELVVPGFYPLANHPFVQAASVAILFSNPAMPLLIFESDEVGKLGVPQGITSGDPASKGWHRSRLTKERMPAETQLIEPVNAVLKKPFLIAKTALVGNPMGEASVFGPMAGNIAVSILFFESHELGKALLPTLFVGHNRTGRRAGLDLSEYAQNIKPADLFRTQSADHPGKTLLHQPIREAVRARIVRDVTMMVKTEKNAQPSKHLFP